jgi:hypothetical protein
MSDTTTRRYRVTAPYVNARVPGGLAPLQAGHTVTWVNLGYYSDALLPEGAHPEDVERLLRKGFLELVDVD